MPQSDIVTAALVVIGEEILSGRTADENISYIAAYLTRAGITLREVRVVPDLEEEIADAVNVLRGRFTYVFTTGGIGPTHDDVTTDAIAKAFGVGVVVDPDAVAAMRKHFSEARADPGQAPHGAGAGGGDPGRQCHLPGARLPNRQRDRHGRRAADHAGHARRCAAVARQGPADPDAFGPRGCT